MLLLLLQSSGSRGWEPRDRVDWSSSLAGLSGTVALSVGGTPVAAAGDAASTGPAVVLKIVPEGEDGGPTTLEGRTIPGREWE